MNAGSKSCVVTNVNIDAVYSDSTTGAIGSLSSFGNVGFNNMTPGTLQ
jgi:hypothetical protein